MKNIITLISTLLLSACVSFNNYDTRKCKPEIFPDYTDIDIPVNIAPLNFMMNGASCLMVEIEGREKWVFKSGGCQMRFPLRKWKKMLETENNETLNVTVYAEISGVKYRFSPFKWTVHAEKIDSYISYRLIEPAYEVWNVLSIEERCTENFNSRNIANNAITGHSCMNCHTSNRAQVPATFLHARSEGGGTLYCRNGNWRKLDTSTDSTSGPAVYGEISKDGRFGIFTTADIRNGLHSAAMERFEVFDNSSDLILLDFEKGTVTDSPVVKGPAFQETFPCWSANDSLIYFCRAESLPQPQRTKEMHYNLFSIAFDSRTGRLADSISLVFDAAAIGKSVSLPKCSPDGKKILFCVSDYGTFPIWHIETDMWMLDIESGEIDKLEQTNGQFSDSYHCWSTNGRWMCWASKRIDRVYGRPFFAFVREDGSVAKGFVLPQENPGFYNFTFKSYNIPELYDVAEPYDAWDVSAFYSDMKTERMEYVKHDTK